MESVICAPVVCFYDHWESELKKHSAEVTSQACHMLAPNYQWAPITLYMFLIHLFEDKYSCSPPLYPDTFC